MIETFKYPSLIYKSIGNQGGDKIENKPILRQNVRILRPNEYKRLHDAVPKLYHRTILDTMLFTGMRYIELERFKEHPEWYDGDFIHLPAMAVKKSRRKQKERSVRLNPRGKGIIPYFLQMTKPMPAYSTWRENLARWAEKAGLYPDHWSSKTLRKTWESWLSFYYPKSHVHIALSQGHTQITSMQHYLNMPFTEDDRIKMKDYVESWIQNGEI